MVKRWGQMEDQKLRYGSLCICDTIDTPYSAEGPKWGQNKRDQSLSHHITILARLIQVSNGEEMGSNRRSEAEIWQFGYLGYG